MVLNTESTAMTTVAKTRQPTTPAPPKPKPGKRNNYIVTVAQANKPPRPSLLHSSNLCMLVNTYKETANKQPTNKTTTTPSLISGTGLYDHVSHGKSNPMAL